MFLEAECDVRKTMYCVSNENNRLIIFIVILILNLVYWIESEGDFWIQEKPMLLYLFHNDFVFLVLFF